jgi:arylsulfatase A-like enzyme
MPLAQGFDYSFGHMGGCIDNYSHFFYWNGPNRHDLWENGEVVYAEGHYFPDLMVEKARTFIHDHKDHPFFIYLAFNTPHYPLQPTAKWRDHYSGLPMPRRDYAAFVSTTDERIGQITQILDDLRLREHTVIIYLSDHGHSYEVRTFGGGGSAGPFRGGKTSLFEGGIRVPAIISWEGHLPEGQVSGVPVMSMDLLPTIADLAGIKELPAGIEGTSLLPTLNDNIPPAHEAMHWQLGRQWAVRKGDWKLIGHPVDPADRNSLDPVKDALFLSNMKIDSTESKNLADAYPEMVDSLIQAYLDWEHGNLESVPPRTPPSDQK